MYFSTTERTEIHRLNFSDFLSTLPPLQAFIAILLAHGYSQSEIAEEFSMTTRNVRYIIARIRQAKMQFDSLSHSTPD